MIQTILSISANIFILILLCFINSLKDDIREIRKSIIEHIGNYRIHGK